jgi:hypothetical protein
MLLLTYLCRHVHIVSQPVQLPLQLRLGLPGVGISAYIAHEAKPLAARADGGWRLCVAANLIAAST